TEVVMAQAPVQFGPVLDRPAALADALGVPQKRLVPALPAQVVSTGAAHLLVAVYRSALRDARPDPAKLATLLTATGAMGFYLYTIEATDPGVVADARFFNPTEGIAEDPATGSAAGPLACYLHRVSPKTGPRFVIGQGHTMGRPSRLVVELEAGSV